MGYGDYSHEAHEAITRGRAHVPRQELFKQRECHPLMNPRGVRVRESRDSEEHPNSLGIAFALDVTGSMGHIPDELARRELPRFMKILGECGVADPQVLFMAVIAIARRSRSDSSRARPSSSISGSPGASSRAAEGRTAPSRTSSRSTSSRSTPTWTVGTSAAGAATCS